MRIGNISGPGDDSGTSDIGSDIGPVTRRKAPIDGGPIASPLIHADAPDDIAVVHVELPAGGGLPEHDHGSSGIVLIPLTGSIELRHDGRTRTLSPGAAAQIPKGERVALANPGTEPASLMVVATPAEFAGRLARWPAV